MDRCYKTTLIEEQYNKAINHLIKVWIHLRTVTLINNQNIMHTDNNNEYQPESSSSTTDSNDELENFLKNKDRTNDSLSVDFNTTNSQTSTMATRTETILKTYLIDQNGLNHSQYTSVLENNGGVFSRVIGTSKNSFDFWVSHEQHKLVLSNFFLV